MYSDELNYGAVLKALGRVLQEKDTTICCQKLQIEQLEERLAAADQELEKAKQERDDAVGLATDVNQQLLDAMCEIQRLKGGAQ